MTREAGSIEQRSDDAACSVPPAPRIRMWLSRIEPEVAGQVAHQAYAVSIVTEHRAVLETSAC
jgi:hypothetical protein